MLVGIAGTVYLIGSGSKSALVLIEHGIDDVHKDDTIRMVSDINDSVMVFVYECPMSYCDQKFDTQEQIYKHLEHAHNKYVCTECHKRLDSQTELDSHLECVHYKYVCTECYDKFDSRVKLDNHLRAIHKKFVCAECHESFDRQKDFVMHKAEKHGKFVCEECCMYFDSQKALDNHLHKNSSNMHKFTCEICGQSTWFKTQQELEHHKKFRHHHVEER